MRFVKPEASSVNILPLLTVGTFGLHLLTLLLLMFNGSLLQQLSRKSKTPGLVQLADGSTLTVEPKQHVERNPETVRRFVGETMTLMFTWSQKQPPRTVWQTGSDLIADGFRKKFESQMINVTPGNQSENLNPGTENVLILQRISQPTQIGDGQWKVEIFANSLLLGSADKLGKSVPFNKQILVRVTDKQATPLPDVPLPLNLAVHRLSEARLELYNMCDIKDINCSSN
jgi:hypothetical protein